jgi:SAM-dependent methyltransferase
MESAPETTSSPWWRVGIGVVSAVLILGIAGFYARAAYLLGRLPENGAAPDRIGSNAPFITTPDPMVEKMVEVAELTPDDLVYDLGCGDGRIVITAALRSGCRGVGFDIDPVRVAEARENVKQHGVEHLVEIREQDVFTVDMQEADVAMFYLLPWMIKKMIPQFQEMQPGSRLVSHDFAFGDTTYIPPEQTIELGQLPDIHYVHRWTIPLQVPPPRLRP